MHIIDAALVEESQPLNLSMNELVSESAAKIKSTTKEVKDVVKVIEVDV